ncbi:MAG: RcnB family protein [Paracoccus marcusii]|nr:MULTISPECIES: RcnB family protein [Paracoccus]TYP68750.1 nickel/cobalt transporter regulator [Stutzerimonas stutzeri]
MTPLHPLAAVAAGTMLGLAALTAPNTTPTRGLQAVPACTTECLGGHATMPMVGDSVPEDQLHRVSAPGRYGLSQAPDGDSYAVVGGHLVRIDADDGRILSVLRPAPRILD